MGDACRGQWMQQTVLPALPQRAPQPRALPSISVCLLLQRAWVPPGHLPSAIPRPCMPPSEHKLAFLTTRFMYVRFHIYTPVCQEGLKDMQLFCAFVKNVILSPPHQSTPSNALETFLSATNTSASQALWDGPSETSSQGLIAEHHCILISPLGLLDTGAWAVGHWSQALPPCPVASLASSAAQPGRVRPSRRKVTVGRCRSFTSTSLPSPPPAATPSSFHTSIMNQAPTH